MSTRPALVALLTSVALLVAGCSPDVVANIGQCPLSPSPESNAGVQGITKRMVPITASRVLLCRYGLDGRLTRAAVLKQIAAAQLEAETNRLARFSGTSSSCHPAQKSFLLTFANDVQQVHVADLCGIVLNEGVFDKATTRWVNELEHYPSVPLLPTGCCKAAGVRQPEHDTFG